MTGQTLYTAWEINPNDKLELSTRKCNKSELTIESFKGLHALVTELCDALKNKSKVKDLGFSFETPYDTIRALSIRNYVLLRAEGSLKGDASTYVAKKYIKSLRIRVSNDLPDRLAFGETILLKIIVFQ